MSAVVLRELVAKLGFQVDDAGFKRASAGVDGLKRGVTEVDRRLSAARGRFLTTGAAAGGASGRFVEAIGRMRDANGRFVGAGGAAAGAVPSGRFLDKLGRMREANGRFVGSGAGKGGQAGAAGLKGTTNEVQRLSAAVGGLQKSLMRLGVSLGLAGLLKQMTTLASDANETENVLEQVFGAQGAAQVKAWADTTSKEIGRSRYTLRDYTGQLGAMLEPMIGNAGKAQEMSTTLAKLSVDLASFFNTADDDALLALKSGIAGETEPLRRYGIVLLDATLQEFAHTQGIHKKITAMTNAQKVELRYQYIMAHTTKAQGDAARTADGFANASRALKDNFKDLFTMAGQKLLPVAGKLIKWANQGIDGFRELGKQSNIVEGSLLAIAAALTAMNAEALIGMAPAILSLVAFAIVADEVKTTLEGGSSLIRDWLEAWGGAGTTAKAIDLLTGSLKALTGSLEGYKKIYEAVPNSALGEWAGQHMTDQMQLSRPDRDARGRRRGHYSKVVSPRVRPMPAEFRVDQGGVTDYSVLPYQDALAPAPRVPAPASAAPAGVTHVQNVTVNHGDINLSTDGSSSAAAVARQAARVADKERRRTEDALKRGGH